ncbi:hypothetical protein [Streptomyces sp. enrichment culture]|uniref:hypothetical protein n=1 Tax=Streptomyces sp. enrichment culture TaxID=1795815 RepID=UPI003F54CD04
MTWVSAVGIFIASGSTVILALKNAETTLVVATAVLTALIVLYLIARKQWVKFAKRDEEEVEASDRPAVDIFASPDRTARSMSTASTQVVTVQGVVLGLVFAFQDGSVESVTIKVGLGSLAFGVSIGLLLVSLCAFAIPGRRTLAISQLLFNITFWSLNYGLVCIASSAIGA